MTKKIVFTHDEVAAAYGAFGSHSLARALNDPAIQHLVVQKLVEGMSEEVFDRLYFQRLSTSPSLAEDRADILAALCPPEQEER